MKRWGLRHRGFRVGVIGVTVCFVLFIIGFAAPAWRNTRGLWMSCTDDHRLCVSHQHPSSTFSFPAWFDAVRALECLGLLVTLLCLLIEAYMDFRSKPSPDRRLVELLAMTGGTCGLIGCIIFAAFTPINQSSSRQKSVYLSWGFGLSTTSSCFLIAFACVIAYFRRKGLDVGRYTDSDAVHYRTSDGIVMPQGLTAADMAPPSYNEVVSQSPPLAGGQGSSDPQSRQGYFKFPGAPDSQPPPAYFPPPPSGHYQAPPPYVMVPAAAPQSERTVPIHTSEGEYANTQSMDTSSGTGLTSSEREYANTQSMDISSGTGLTSPARVRASPDVSHDQAAGDHLPSETEFNLSENPAETLPAYYVMLFGQMVPVTRDELQQAGRDVPAEGSLVPAYFIVVQGQHVPVYSEEQAQTLAS